MWRLVGEPGGYCESKLGVVVGAAEIEGVGGM